MYRVDEIFTEYPFYGSCRIREALRCEGFEIGRERAQACMRQMGLRAIYPKGNLSKKHPGNKIYPYLLADIEIAHLSQSSVGKRYYAPTAQARIRVPCGYYRLV